MTDDGSLDSTVERGGKVFPFFEVHPLVNDIYAEVLKIEARGIHDSYDISEQIRNRFSELGTQSYDCHSFAFALFRAMGIKAPRTVIIKKPNRDHFEFETDYLVNLRDRIKSAQTKGDGLECVNEQRGFTEWVYNHSNHLDITGRDIDNFETAEEEAKRITTEIMSELRTPSSRYLLVADGKPGNGFYDAHSTILLGETQDGKDIWVLEGGEIGSNIAVRKLSEVIFQYNCITAHKYKSLSISLLRVPMEDL